MCYSFINPITRHLSMAFPSLPPAQSGHSPWCWICLPHVAVAPWLHCAAQETTDSLLAGRHGPASHSRGLIKPHAPVHIPLFDRHAFEVHYSECVITCSVSVNLTPAPGWYDAHFRNKCVWETFGFGVSSFKLFFFIYTVVQPCVAHSICLILFICDFKSEYGLWCTECA